MNPFEFYETPETFTRALIRTLLDRGFPIAGRLCEPCVGSGAIVRAFASLPVAPSWPITGWHLNDLDPRWAAIADTTADATDPAWWATLGPIEWIVTNPPYSQARTIADLAIRAARVGVAMHVRLSALETLKGDPGWWAAHEPTGLILLPRFAYQRSRRSGEWQTDSVTSAWVVWTAPDVRPFVPAFFAFPDVVAEIDAETPGHRARMDQIAAQWAAERLPTGGAAGSASTPAPDDG